VNPGDVATRRKIRRALTCPRPAEGLHQRITPVIKLSTKFEIELDLSLVISIISLIFAVLG
jgi:hypothetical protein